MSTRGQGALGLLRSRSDLLITRSGDGWVVKDPLSLEYFRIGARERFLLEQLRRPLDLEELTRRYRERFPNERATAKHVLSFCSALAECSLLVGRPPKSATQRTPWWATALSPLAIRLPGVDPSWLLDSTAWLGRMVFSRLFYAVVLCALGIVGIGLVGRAEEFLAELGLLANLFQPEYALMAILAVIATKSWHELGHAIACRRMGAECHEIGVMLLALTPCLYCDVSDAWTLPERRRRIAVAVGGVYFELLLAIAAMVVWLCLAPGPLRVLAMMVIVASTISTLLINLNPLLRFDGYYVLADLWDVPNLRSVSRDALLGGLRSWVRGERTPPEPLAASRWSLATYGALSSVYGLFVLAVILGALHGALAAVGFRSLGDLLVAASALGFAYGVVRSAIGFVPRGPGTPKVAPLARLALLGGLFGALVIGVLSIEIEQSLKSPCRIEHAVSADIVARGDGLLRPLVAAGDRVTAGQLLAELEDPAAELRLVELRLREAELQQQLSGLKTRSQADADLLAEIARLRPTLVEVRRQIVAHQQESLRRELRAPIEGVVAPAAERPRAMPEDASEERLPGWDGHPLDRANAGCLLASGETLCRIAGEGLQAVVLLDEYDSGLVRLGDTVRLLLTRAPAVEFAGQIESVALEVAADRLTEAERRLEESLRGPLEESAAYRVTVSISGATPSCQAGAVGWARIVTGRETVGGLCLRWFRRLVRFG